MWLDFAFHQLFGLTERLSEATADLYYDTIAKTATPEFLPRALYERFNLEVLATTDSPLDSLADHQAIRDSGWKARIFPPSVPTRSSIRNSQALRQHCELGPANRRRYPTWTGYLNALRKARARFRSLGCTATDHGHPTRANRRPRSRS
jgi:glucuronate isomerase